MPADCSSSRSPGGSADIKALFREACFSRLKTSFLKAPLLSHPMSEQSKSLPHLRTRTCED
eukprot:3687759-Karenia_brevis.AAC.1